MSRLHLRDDQIHTLDRDTLSSLHDELNEELCILAEVERSIYKRKRVLDIEDDPSLLEDKYAPSIQAQRPRKKTPSYTTNELIQALKGLDLDKINLKQFTK